MQTAERHPLPRGRTAVAWLLWLLASVLVAGLAWLFLRGCGLSGPGGGQPLIAFCSAEASVREDELLELSARQESLEEQLWQLRRRISDVPMCVPGMACDIASPDAVVDIYFLQDLSSSFDDDLGNVRRMIDDLLARKENGELGPNVAIGLGSFIDKPDSPESELAGDYTFKAHASLADPPDVLRSAARELAVGYGGYDADEAQFEAIVEMLGAGGSVGFRPEATKYVIVVTDAPARRDGDFPAGVAEDGVADGDPLNEDYPSPEQVSELLRENDVIPVFLGAGSIVQGFYQAFIDTHGIGDVGLITATSENLTEAILLSLANTCSG
jgi:hypothetical protein